LHIKFPPPAAPGEERIPTVGGRHNASGRSDVHVSPRETSTRGTPLARSLTHTQTPLTLTAPTSQHIDVGPARSPAMALEEFTGVSVARGSLVLCQEAAAFAIFQQPSRPQLQPEFFAQSGAAAPGSEISICSLSDGFLGDCAQLFCNRILSVSVIFFKYISKYRPLLSFRAFAPTVHFSSQECMLIMVQSQRRSCI